MEQQFKPIIPPDESSDDTSIASADLNGSLEGHHPRHPTGPDAGQMAKLRSSFFWQGAKIVLSMAHDTAVQYATANGGIEGATGVQGDRIELHLITTNPNDPRLEVSRKVLVNEEFDLFEMLVNTIHDYAQTILGHTVATAAILLTIGSVPSQVPHYDAKEEVQTTLVNMSSGPATVKYDNSPIESLPQALVQSWKAKFGHLLENDVARFWNDVTEMLTQLDDDTTSAFHCYGRLLLLVNEEDHVHEQGSAQPGDVSLINGIHNGPVQPIGNPQSQLFIFSIPPGSQASYDGDTQWTQIHVILEIHRAMSNIRESSARHGKVWKEMVKHYYKINQRGDAWTKWTDLLDPLNLDHPKDDLNYQIMLAYEKEAHREYMGLDKHYTKAKRRKQY